VTVGTPHRGWPLADDIYAALLAAAAAGDAPAANRLAVDTALQELTLTGSKVFESPGLRPSQTPDVEFVALAARRASGPDDDLLPLSSALALEGVNVGSSVYESATDAVPMHVTSLLLGDGFFDSYLAPALGAEPPAALLEASGPVRNSVAMSAPGSGAVQLSTEGAGGKFTQEATVSAAATVTFSEYSTRGRVSLEALSPSGKLIGALEAELDPNAAYSEGRSEGGLAVAQLSVTDPEPGAWRVTVTTTEETLAFGKFAEQGSLEATFALNGFTFAGGDELNVTAAVSDPAATVDVARATLLSPDSVSTVVPLADDGLGADATAGDAVYSGSLNLPMRASAVGRWTAAGELAGSVQGFAYERAATLVFDLNASEIRSLDSFSQSLSDPGGDGVIDALAIDLDVEITEPGTYLVAGKLSAPGGQDAGEASAVLEAVGAGALSATLSFPGEAVSASGASGKFTMSELVLGKLEPVPTIVSEQQDVFETPALDMAQFAVRSRPGLRLTAPNAESPLADESFTITWEDTDPDSDATITLFLDDDGNGFDGQVIAGAEALSENDEADAFVVDISSFADGLWFVHALIDDGEHAEAVYAPAALRIGRDTDGDGLLDSVEISLGLDPLTADSSADDDGDRLTNAFEVAFGTLPAVADTDGGGEKDGRELLYGREPRVSGDDVVLAPDAVLGDVGPPLGPDGAVSISDVVRMLRLSVAVVVPTPEDVVRGDLAPAVSVDPGITPEPLLRVGDAELTVADVLLVLRTVVELVEVTEAD
jgi:hypothetical protein